MLITNLKVDCYSTGCYGEKKADGLTLRFMVEGEELDCYTIFNVDCSRSRGPNKGAKRPAGQFSVRKQHSFYKFWHHTCGLPTPSKGLTTFHDCMGKLKGLRFQAESLDGKKLEKHTLVLMAELPTDNIAISPDNYPTTSRRVPDNFPVTAPDKDMLQTPAYPAMESNVTTCENKYVISKQVSEYTSTSTNPSSIYTDESSRVANQTIEEWRADYDAVWSAQCEELF
tara:strand:+ start:3019 stop:3699 length:681 start_codon:yes stop_codon:yes gene_type:complete